MAKDDYQVIVFKVLMYLYAVYKRKTVFDEKALYHAVGIKRINEGTFIDTLRFMSQEGYIEVSFCE